MDERYSYRPQFSFTGPMTPMVKKIIITSVAVYILQVISQLQGIEFISYFGLIPYQVTHNYFVYQLASYIFLHGGLMHLIINMFVLSMFGGEIEYALGSRRFLFYYLLCGVGSGIVTSVFLHDSIIPVVGASGAIYGLLLAYGLFFPNRMVLFMFIFPIKVKYMVVIFAFIEFMSTINYSQDGISHVTHLGGMIIGLIYLLWFRGNLNREGIKRQFRRFKQDSDHDEHMTLH